MKNKVGLMCDECHIINYSTIKSDLEPLNKKKYCKKCKKHTLHKETK